ncbi:hypothetical protein JKP88DRAFT_251596 [Tribonema minus]|uniref:Uncharacterized protein n=1 Tax=Tribonema minus TaxID=303371 RepID=A0A835ZCN4_9STRA|nr:hypothetical protein JKP88DRAFT_251596 [Tribonema minus]
MEFALGTALGGVLLHMYSKTRSDVDDPTRIPLGAPGDEYADLADASAPEPPVPPVPRVPLPAAPSATTSVRRIYGPDFEDPEHEDPGAPIFRTIAPYPTQDISDPYTNELDGQYMNFMSTMHSGLIARKEAVKQRIERMKHAEANSEAARVMKIIDTPVPDRDPTPASNTKYPAWMRATDAPPLPKRTQVLPLPPAEDIYGQGETQHRKSLMSTIVGSYGKAGTSTYKNWALPVKQEWTGYGTGQGSIAPKWERPSFVLERTDKDVQPSLPPQAVASSMQPSFRSQENASVGVSRSFNLHVDTTSAPGAYAVPLGAAVVAPSEAAPLKQTTLGIGPQGTGLGVLPAGGAKAPQASIRLKLGGIKIDPSSLPPNQIAAFTVGTGFSSNVRLTDDTSTAVVPSADAAGRADYPSAPATEMSADPDRYADADARDARASVLTTTTNTVSGTVSASATPAVRSGHDGLNYVSDEQLKSRTAAIMRQMDTVSGAVPANATPAVHSGHDGLNYVSNEQLESRTAALMRQLDTVSGAVPANATPAVHSGHDGLNYVSNEQLESRTAAIMRQIDISGVYSAPAQPASESDRSEAAHLQQEAIGLKSAILQMQSSDMSGPASGATPAPYEAGQRVDDLLDLQDRLGYVLQRIAVTSGTPSAPAVPSEVEHLRDDKGVNPEEPDGRGASTSSKIGAFHGDSVLRGAQGFTFDQSAPHAAFVGVSVDQPPRAAHAMVGAGLRTAGNPDRLAQSSFSQNEQRSADVSRLGLRGPSAGVREVDHNVPQGRVRENMGMQAMASAPGEAPVPGEMGDVQRQHIQTRDSASGLGHEMERMGFMVKSDMEFRDSVSADRDVTSLVPPRRGGDTVEVVYAPLRQSKDMQLNLFESSRQTLTPMGTSTPTVRDVILGRRRS